MPAMMLENQRRKRSGNVSFRSNRVHILIEIYCLTHNFSLNSRTRPIWGSSKCQVQPNQVANDCSQNGRIQLLQFLGKPFPSFSIHFVLFLTEYNFQQILICL